MSNIDKQALRTAAENAMPGEWCTDDYHGVIADAGLNANYYIASCSGPDNRSNKRFIAAANPATVLALLDELEAKDRRIAKLSTKRARDVETLQSELIQARIRAEDAEKRIAESSGQKRLIGWRASDYTDETSDPELAKNWAAAIGVLPIFEGDVNTKLSAAGIGKGA